MSSAYVDVVDARGPEASVRFGRWSGLSPNQGDVSSVKVVMKAQRKVCVEKRIMHYNVYFMMLPTSPLPGYPIQVNPLPQRQCYDVNAVNK